jgi:hypothetical protein
MKWPEDSWPPFNHGGIPPREWWPRDPAHRPPWQPIQPMPVHVAKTVTVASGAGLLRAADSQPKRE